MPKPNGGDLAAHEAARCFTDGIGRFALTHPMTDRLIEDLARVFDAAFLLHAHIVLAVSGGSDSTALMFLAAAWRRQRQLRFGTGSKQAAIPTFSVLTIDHALRTGSADEAVMVAEAAAALHLPHTIRRWAGPKPVTGLQAAARAARYDLIRTHLAVNDWAAIATAHTADDQAETLLMRLARGSGVDGLGAMRAATHLGPGQTLLRPLLAVPKSTLTDFLARHSLPWSDDPSNQSPSFERVRWRHLQASSTAAGLGLNSAALARAAGRAARASTALQDLTRRAWSQRGDHATFDALGTASIDWAWLLDHPEEIRLRLLAGLLDTIGGQGRPVSLNRLEDVTVRRSWRHRPVGTLHGVMFGQHGQPQTSSLSLTREWGRAPFEQLELVPGESVIWDRRFAVSLGADAHGLVQVGPLGEPRWDDPICGAHALWTAALQARITTGIETGMSFYPPMLRTLPVLRDPEGIAAIPSLGYRRAGFSGTVTSSPVVPWFCRVQAHG